MDRTDKIFIVSILLMLIGVLNACADSTASDSNNKEYNTPIPLVANTAKWEIVSQDTRTTYPTYRLIDKETNTVCYRYGYEKTLSCVALHDTTKATNNPFEKQ